MPAYFYFFFKTHTETGSASLSRALVATAASAVTFFFFLPLLQKSSAREMDCTALIIAMTFTQRAYGCGTSTLASFAMHSPTTLKKCRSLNLKKKKMCFEKMHAVMYLTREMFLFLFFLEHKAAGCGLKRVSVVAPVYIFPGLQPFIFRYL